MLISIILKSLKQSEEFNLFLESAFYNISGLMPEIR